MANNEMTMREFLSRMEYPFIRMDMTIEEFHEEKEYFMHHYDDYKKGTYKSLWEQKKMLCK